MKKKEIVAWSIIAVILFNHITGIVVRFEAGGGLELLFYLASVTFILFAGFSIYKPEGDVSKTALFIGIGSGIAFSSAILAFSSNIWNHSNTLALLFEIPNILLCLFLTYFIIRYRKKEPLEKIRFYKGLLLRSALLFFLFAVIASLPFYIINIYFNRNHRILHNRGLAEEFYLKSLKLSEEDQFNEALNYANKSLESNKIGWENDNKRALKINQAFYKAYWGLMNESFDKGELNHVIEQYALIKSPIHEWYGDTSLEQAKTLVLLGKANQGLSFFDQADSLYKESAKIYLSYYGGQKNMYYAISLKHLGNSYFEQNYYTDALNVFKSVIQILEKDTTTYFSGEDNEEGKKAGQTKLDNIIALSNSDIGHIFSIKGLYDSADVYFTKAFEVTSFTSAVDYPKAMVHYAFHQVNKGDFMKAKLIMQQALTLTSKQSGEKSYGYLEVLSGLNKLNTTLCNYTEAERGCKQALAILSKITPKQDDYYASLLLEYATVKQHQGSYNEAKELMEKALLCTDSKSYQYADILQSLSGLYADLSEYHQAFDFAKEASRLAQVYFESSTNQYLTQFIRTEAYTHYLLGNTKEAESLYKRCYNIDTLNKTFDKLSFAATLNGLALVKTKTNNFKIADTLYNASLDLYKKHTGENNSDYAIVLYNKAYLKLDEGKLLETEQLLTASQRILLKILGDKHDKIADNYIAFGKLKVKEKKYTEALSYFNQAFIIYKLKFKPTHQKYIESLHLINLYQ